MTEALIRYQHLGMTEKLDLITQHAALFVCGAGQRKDAILVMRMALELLAEHKAAKAAEVFISQSEKPTPTPPSTADMHGALNASVRQAEQERTGATLEERFDEVSAVMEEETPQGYDDVVRRLGQMTDEVQRLRRLNDKINKDRNIVQDTLVARNRENTALKMQAKSKDDQIALLTKAMQRPITDDRERNELERLMKALPQVRA